MTNKSIVCDKISNIQEEKMKQEISFEKYLEMQAMLMSDGGSPLMAKVKCDKILEINNCIVEGSINKNESISEDEFIMKFLYQRRA